VGSIALFLVLTAVMVLTRKVNWYGLTPAPRNPNAATGAATTTDKDAP
jgi:inner membrane protein